MTVILFAAGLILGFLITPEFLCRHQIKSGLQISTADIVIKIGIQS